MDMGQAALFLGLAALWPIAVEAAGTARVPGQDHPQAPDGRRGLGAETEHKDILRLFRQPDENDEVFLAGLDEVRRDLDVLVATLEGLYWARGTFDLLEPRDEATLPRLHAVFHGYSLDLGATLARDDKVGRTFATLFLDTRFRARMRILDGLEEDEQEVHRGLAVLRAQTDGWVRLTDGEASNVARRVDLAAALLRARYKDLEALREAPGSAPDISMTHLAELFAAASGANERERKLRLAEAELREIDRAVAMLELLFTPMLEREVEDLILWRRARDERGELLLHESRFLQPNTPEGQDAPPDVQKQTKTKRRRAAYHKALEGLYEDPLNEELAYVAARMSRYVGGTLEALSHYDRFLALRGIRSHDHRTYQDRELDEKEKDALFFVQQETPQEPPKLPEFPTAG